MTAPEQPLQITPPIAENPLVSRRSVLGLGIALGVAALTEGCGDSPTTPESADPNVIASSEAASPSDDPAPEQERNDKQEQMFFLHMPTDTESAKAQAAETAATLKDLAQSGSKPYIVMEPSSPSGDKLDLRKLPVGAFASFLKGLKEAGVSDDQLGTLVVCPEPNEPIWGKGGMDPELYKHNVTSLGAQLKHVFPDAKLGILLNSTSYADADWSGADKSAAAITQYTDGLQGVDELCFQGNAWSNDTPKDLRNYLNADVAMAAAASLGGPKTVALRFETATYATQVNPDTQAAETMDAGTRRQVLAQALAEVRKAKDAGYDATLQVFAENKAATDEQTDWSYDRSPEDADTLKTTLDAAQKAGIRTVVFN